MVAPCIRCTCWIQHPNWQPVLWEVGRGKPHRFECDWSSSFGYKPTYYSFSYSQSSLSVSYTHCFCPTATSNWFISPYLCRSHIPKCCLHLQDHAWRGEWDGEHKEEPCYRANDCGWLWSAAGHQSNICKTRYVSVFISLTKKEEYRLQLRKQMRFHFSEVYFWKLLILWLKQSWMKCKNMHFGIVLVWVSSG